MRPTTERTKRWFEAQGCLVGHVEKWIAQTKRRQDLFGAFDQIVIGYEPWPTLYVQSCAGARHADHLAAMRENPNVRRVLEEGNGAALVSWRKGGPRGERKTWQPRIEMITLNEWSGNGDAVPAPRRLGQILKEMTGEGRYLSESDRSILTHQPPQRRGEGEE